MINIKRIYEKTSEEDGFRILVDRSWPPGMTKDNIKINEWLKDIGPSNILRKWFHPQEDKWEEFKKKYQDELKTKDELVNTIINKSKEGTVTLLYASKDKKYNNAIALKEYIESKISLPTSKEPKEETSKEETSESTSKEPKEETSESTSKEPKEETSESTSKEPKEETSEFNY